MFGGGGLWGCGVYISELGWEWGVDIAENWQAKDLLTLPFGRGGQACLAGHRGGWRVNCFPNAGRRTPAHTQRRKEKQIKANARPPSPCKCEPSSDSFFPCEGPCSIIALLLHHLFPYRFALYIRDCWTCRHSWAHIYMHLAFAFMLLGSLVHSFPSSIRPVDATTCKIEFLHPAPLLLAT